MIQSDYELRPIGFIRSSITDITQAPRQGDEGGVDAWLEINPDMQVGLAGIQIGTQLMLITWLHQAQRDVLEVHPRGDQSRSVTGVFTTRSPHRPNPIGLHEVTVLAIEQNKLKVGPLEAIDGTPILDLKAVLGNDIASR